MGGTQDNAQQHALCPVLDPLSQAGPLGIALLDVDLRCTSVNQAAADAHGLTPRDHVGLRFSDVNPHLAAVLDPLIRRVIETGDPLIDLDVTATVPGPPDRPYRALTSIHPIHHDHTLTGIAVIWWDVTDRADQHVLIGDAERRFRAMADAAPVMMWLTAADGRTTWVNRRWTEWTGRSLPQAAGFAWLDAVHPDDRASVHTALTDPQQRGGLTETVYRLRRADETYGWVIQRAVPRPSRDGDDAGLIGTCTDISELHDLQERVTATKEHLERLGRLTAALSSAATTDSVIDAMLEHALPAVGATAGIAAILDDSETTLRTVGARGYEDDIIDAVATIDISADVPLAAVVRTRRRVTYADRQELLAALPRMTDHVDVPYDVAVAAIPIQTGRRLYGAFAVSFANPYDCTEENCDVLETVVAQCAQAYERAYLHERAAGVAARLQRSLLPPRLPDIPGIELAARYVAADDRLDVGGDFYDAFAVDDRWVLAMGDVRGRGVGAAAVTGIARTTLRTAARFDPSPARLLDHLNTGLLEREQVRQDEPLRIPRFCTVCVAVLEPGPPQDPPCVHVTFCCGGHPLPIIVRAAGGTESTGTPGTLLGVVDEPVLPETTTTLQPGDVMVFVTDGILERRDGARFFEDELPAVLNACRGGTADDIAAYVERAARAFGPDAPNDDMALLVARVPA